MKTSLPKSDGLPREPLWIAAGLLTLVAVVFRSLWSADFLTYDDTEYVFSNPHVTAGFTLEGLLWSFTTLMGGFWHPLTWLSHMLDFQLFGPFPGWHHLTNIALHGFSSILLLQFLREATGALWRSALVAALFAIHPLHVESVAWITERKDTLCGVFFLSAVWCYSRYAKNPGLVPWRSKYWWLTFLAFVFALMSKSTAMTLPVLLLLLDWWPLRSSPVNQVADPPSDHARLGSRAFWLGKTPFMVAAALSLFVTWQAQIGDKMVHSTEQFAISHRLANACVSCAIYLGQMLCPVHLAVFYPYRTDIPLASVVCSIMLLLVISLLAFQQRRSRPYLLFGWAWFLISLAPVLGLVQTGIHAHADRYTYFPAIGIFVAVVWGLAELLSAMRLLPVAQGLAAAALAGCAITSITQTQYWLSSETLFLRDLAVAGENEVALCNLGGWSLKNHHYQEAEKYFRRALLVNPASEDACCDLGVALWSQGENQQAVQVFRDWLRREPNRASAHANLGSALFRMGALDEAISEHRAAIRLNPLNAGLHVNLGNTLLSAGRATEAVTEYQAAIEIEPGLAYAHFCLGFALGQTGRSDAAISEYRTAVRLNPGLVDAHFNLATALAKLNQTTESIREFEAALALRPGDANGHLRLALLLLSVGQREESILHLNEALRLNPDLSEARQALASLGATTK